MESKKYLSTLALACIVLGSLPATVSAESLPYGNRDMENIDLTNAYEPSQIYVSTLKTALVDGAKVEGSFTVLSQEPQDIVGDLQYRIEVSDSSDNQFIESTPVDLPSLAPGATYTSDFSYDVSALPNGTYKFVVQILNAGGRELGWATEYITVSGSTDNFILLSEPSLVLAEFGDQTFEPSTGPNTDPGAPIGLSARATNNSSTKIVAYPEVRIYPFDSARGVLQTITLDPVVLEAHEEKELLFTVPAVSTPGVYITVLSLKGENGLTSNIAQYRTVTRGPSADVLSARLTTPALRKGESAFITVEYAGSADAETYFDGSVQVDLQDSVGSLGNVIVGGIHLTDAIGSGMARVALSRDMVGSPSMIVTIRDQESRVLSSRTFDANISLETLAELRNNTIRSQTISWYLRPVWLFLVAVVLLLLFAGILLVRRVSRISFAQLSNVAHRPLAAFVILSIIFANFSVVDAQNFTPILAHEVVEDSEPDIPDTSDRNFPAVGNGIVVNSARSMASIWGRFPDRNVVSIFVNRPIHNAPVGTYQCNAVPLEYRVEFGVCKNTLAQAHVIVRSDTNGGLQTTLDGVNANWKVVYNFMHTKGNCAGALVKNDGICVVAKEKSTTVNITPDAGKYSTTLQVAAKWTSGNTAYFLPVEDTTLPPNQLNVISARNLWVHCSEPPRCGNSTVEAPEQCDDGNQNNNDRCTNQCQFTRCGDGTVQSPNGAGQQEQCDDGNTNNADACTNQCQLTRCGDGIVQNPNGSGQPEQCDDGNQNNSDSCNNSCQTPVLVTDLEVNKTGPATVDSNDVITYKLEVKNSGPARANDIIVRDIIPAGLTYRDDLSETPCNQVGNAVECPLEYLSANQTRSFTVKFDVNPGTCGIVQNRASVQTVTQDTNPANNLSAVVSTNIECPVQNTDLRIQKSAPATVSNDATGTFNYTLNVTNLTSVPAVNAVVSDTIPAEFTVAGLPSNCTQNARTVQCTLGTVAANGGATITIPVTVQARTVCDRTISNTATVATTTQDSAMQNNTATAQTNFTCGALTTDLEIIKTAPATVQSTDVVTYKLTVTNKGLARAENIVVRDTIPAGLTYNDALSEAPCNQVNATTVECPLEYLSEGQTRSFTLKFDANPGTCGAVSNRATVATTTTDTNQANNVSDATTNVICAPVNTDLKIEKDGPASFNNDASGVLYYTIKVTNMTAVAAENVIISDALPAPLTLQSVPQNCSNNGGTVQCNLGTLAGNATKTITIPVLAAARAACGQSITNRATVTTTTQETNSQNNADDARTSFTCSTPPPPASCPADGSIRMRVEFFRVANVNAGDALAQVDLGNGQTVSSNQSIDLFRNGAFITDPSISTRRGLNVKRGENSLTFRNHGLAEDFVTRETMHGRIILEGGRFTNFTNRPNVTDPLEEQGNQTYDEDAGNDEVFFQPGSHVVPFYTTVSTGSDNFLLNYEPDPACITPTDLEIIKTAPATVQSTDTVTYKLAVTNKSNTRAENIVVRDTIPAGLTYNDALSEAPCNQVNATTVECPLAFLSTNQTRTFTLVFTVNQNTCGPVSNRATVATTTTDTNQANNVSDATTNVICAPATTDLEIIKTAPATVQSTDVVTYKLAVTNKSNTRAENIVVRDTIPAGLTYNDALSEAPCNQVNATTVECPLEYLSGGQTRTFTLKFDANPGTCGVVSNRATVATTTTDTNQANNVSDATTTVMCVQPSFAITKTDNRTQVQPGEQLTYTITVTNTSSVQATNVTVRDTLPSFLTYVSSTAGGVHAGQIVTWSNQTFGPHDQKTFTINATVNASAPNGTILHNTATVNDTIQAFDDTTVVVPVLTGCINVVKVANDEQNQPISPVPAFTFRLGGGQQVVSNAAGTAQFTNVATGQQIVTEDLPTGWTQSSIVPAGGQVTVNPGNQCATVTFTNKRNLNADVRIVKTGLATAQFGSQITYSIVATNDGPADAQNVVIKDIIPQGMTFVSASGVTCANVNGEIQCQIGSLLKNQSTPIITVTLMAPAAPTSCSTSSVTNTAVVQTSSTDTNVANNQSSATTQLTCPAPNTADLSVVKTGTVTAQYGSQVAYSLNVTNSGPSSVNNVIISDTFPAGLTYVSVSGATCQLALPSNSPTIGGILTCDVGTVAAGAQKNVQFTFSTQVPAQCAQTTVINNVSVTENDPIITDPNAANNQSAASTTLTCPQDVSADIAVLKFGPSTVVRGNQVTYSLIVTNYGPGTAQGVTLSDPIPQGLTFVSSSGAQCSVANNALQCTIGTLAPGQTSAIITATFLAPTLQTCAVSSVTNTATVATTTLDPQLGNNSSSATTSITCPAADTADLSVVKTGTVTAQYGSQLTYSVNVTNNGPSAVNNVIINDTFPVNLTYVSVSGATCNLALPSNSPTIGGVLTCDVGTLAAGAQKNVQFIFSTPATGKCDLTSAINHVSVTENDPNVTDPNAANNQSAASTTLTCPTTTTDLSITKTGQSTVVRGSTVTYTIVATNNGPSSATNVVVTDAFSSEYTYVSASGATCSTNGNVLTCNLGTMTSGQSVTITAIFTARTVSGTCTTATVTNTASVTSDVTETITSNNTSSIVTTQFTCPTADISVYKTDNRSTANVLDRLRYSIIITNNTSTAATNLLVTDNVPYGLTILTVSDGGTVNGQQVRWTDISVPANSSRTLYIDTEVRSDVSNGTVVRNTVDVNGKTAIDETTIYGSIVNPPPYYPPNPPPPYYPPNPPPYYPPNPPPPYYPPNPPPIYPQTGDEGANLYGEKNDSSSLTAVKPEAAQDDNGYSAVFYATLVALLAAGSAVASRFLFAL